MKAIRYYRYGPPEVLELADIDMPGVGDDDILVRVRAASVNPLDWHFMRGTPFLLRIMVGLSRPKASETRLGADMAGSVEAVGRNVTEFQLGDEMFGGVESRGTLAEYVSLRHDGVVLKSRPACRSRKRPRCRSQHSRPCRLCATRDRSGRDTRSWSMVRPEAWGRSRCRSPRRSALR
jgi:NADPH:quinone reductase-like Zn-dependent oxidoreductase